MKFKSSAPKGQDVRKSVSQMTLTAESHEERQILAALRNRAETFGLSAVLVEGLGRAAMSDRPYTPHPGEHPDTRHGSARDPDEAVRELAEKFADERLYATGAQDPRNELWASHRTRLVRQYESRLTAFLSEREVDLACAEGLSEQVADLQATVARLEGERDRALGEGEQVREALAQFLPPWKDFLRETHDLSDNDPHCPGHEPTVGDYRSGFAALTASPLSKLAGDLLRESLRHAQASRLCEDGGFEGSAYDLDDLSGSRFRAAAYALQAELAREGGEAPNG